MTLRRVFQFRFFNILLLISGQQCLTINPFATVSSNILPVISESNAATPRSVTGTTRPNIKHDVNTLLARGQIHDTPTLRYAKVIGLPSSSATQTRAPITPPLEHTISPSSPRPRGLVGDLFNSLSNNFGIAGSSKTPTAPPPTTPLVAQRQEVPSPLPVAVPIVAQRQVVQSPSPVASAASNWPTPTPTANPTLLPAAAQTPFPTPTQAADASNDSSKSQSRLPASSSTTWSNAKSMTSKGSRSSAEHTSTALASKPSKEPTTNDRSTPAPSANKLSSLFKPSNRLAPVAIMVTCGLAFGCLVTLISMVKCLCHRKRFANKKDYPQGFPWVPPTPKQDRVEGRRQGLLSRTASLMSTRNSITPSAHFHAANVHPDSRPNSHYVDYQLSDLRSPSDVDAGYPFALQDDSTKGFESGSSDELPSSSSTDESSQLPPLEMSLDVKPDNGQWDMRSANASPSWFFGGEPAKDPTKSWT